MADIVDLIYADHDYFRRYFFLLDQAATVEEQTAIWEPLATRLDTHAQAEEEIFYPALLKRGDADEAEDETEDAIKDHNKIRDAVREARQHPVGSDEWQAAVADARQENGEHLEEEEREGLPDFLKHASAELRHDLAMRWLKFYYQHQAGRGVDDSDRDVEEYLEDNS